MYKTIDYTQLAGSYILIDVRSPGEFAEASIPGAISLPLFSDAERSLIGTVYVHESIEKAKMIGIEAVSSKLPELFNEITALNKVYDQLVFYCAKGGMRSASLVALLNELGIRAVKLKGGYKGYRAFLNSALPKANEPIRYIVLHGKTGTGKTDLLAMLKQRGFNVLDLENAAHHRGSLLGSVGLGCQNSQKQFESLVYETLKNRTSDHIFVEGESKRIGNIIIPDYIFRSMEEGLHLYADSSMKNRIQRVIKDYTAVEGFQNEIMEAIEKLRRYIGDKSAEGYKQLVCQGHFEEVAQELMEKYYDPMYTNDIDRYSYGLQFSTDDLETSCKLIEKWFAATAE
jgi:tRNA 2-selenouridine synthase